MKVFISYRRADMGGHAAGFVGRICDRLEGQYGHGNVFMDVDSIPYGEDFVEYLASQVAQTDALIAVIGPQWAEQMAARAGEDNDFVRIEVETALQRGIRVIPVLVGGALMPGDAGLPASILPLRRRNALTLDSGRDFSVHMGRLIEALNAPRAVPEAPKPAAPAPAPATPLVHVRKAGETMTGPHGIELVWCPPGTFTMGEGDGAHQVTLTKGFWIGKTPVTQDQWQKVMGSNPSHFKGPQKPVEMVSWNDAQEFLNKLGAGYRLPTEAEWEYACRAGSTTRYCFGDSQGELREYAWFAPNRGRTTYPVGQKKPNAWGIHDMHGNVCEWCQDWYGGYPKGAVTDPTGADQASARVRRGGSWHDVASLCLSAYRYGSEPGYRYSTLGFRVAADTK